VDREDRARRVCQETLATSVHPGFREHRAGPADSVELATPARREVRVPEVVPAAADPLASPVRIYADIMSISGWLGNRVVSVLDSGAKGPGFKSQSRRCRATVLGKLFTPIVSLFTEHQNW